MYSCAFIEFSGDTSILASAGVAVNWYEPSLNLVSGCFLLSDIPTIQAVAGVTKIMDSELADEELNTTVADINGV